MGYRIREAQLEKIPYMLIVGDKEIADGTVSVRARSGGDIGTMTLDDFLCESKKRKSRQGTSKNRNNTVIAIYKAGYDCCP